MTNVIRDTHRNMDMQKQLRDELEARIDALSPADLEVAVRFLRQIIAYHDPDVVQDFLEWREDPRLGSILQLAAAISDELREELLFVAEDIYASEKLRERS